MYQKCIDLLNERGVALSDIAECVLYLQGKYYPDLTMELAEKAVKGVIEKREVQHAIITGLFLDKSAETDMCDPELKDILMRDEGLYGIDEVLAYGICNLYGSIALTNYGMRYAIHSSMILSVLLRLRLQVNWHIAIINKIVYNKLYN